MTTQVKKSKVIKLTATEQAAFEKVRAVLQERDGGEPTNAQVLRHLINQDVAPDFDPKKRVSVELRLTEEQTQLVKAKASRLNMTVQRMVTKALEDYDFTEA